MWRHLLQVRDTLVAMAAAGVSVWILTGDKKETAINISYACGHLQPGMAVRSLSCTSLLALLLILMVSLFIFPLVPRCWI